MRGNHFTFTKSKVEDIPPPAPEQFGKVGYVIHWDRKIAGLGLQVRPSGTKTFILVYRNKAGRTRRLTIGRFGRLTVEQARAAAKHHNGIVALGGDPVMDRHVLRATKTLDQIFAEYISEHLEPNCSEQAVRSCKRVQRLLKGG